MLLAGVGLEAARFSRALPLPVELDSSVQRSYASPLLDELERRTRRDGMQ